MLETMRRVKGLGLAATQVGWSRRLAIVSGTGEEGDERIVINPEVLSEHGAIALEEGCLSFPGITGLITRPERITVRYSNRSPDVRKRPKP